MAKNPKTKAEISVIKRRLSAIHVASDRDLLVRDAIDGLLDRDEAGELMPRPHRYSRGLECQGLVVVDGSGGGKTRILSDCLNKHPVLGTSATGSPRFLHVTVPSPATLKSLGCEILRTSGYPDISERRERWSIWNIVRRRLTILDTVVLWIDEAHDFINTRGEVADLLKTLKRLMQGDQSFIVVLSGTERLLKLIYSDDEVQRRFRKIQFPVLFDAIEGDALRGVIARFSEIAGLKPPSEADLVSRLIHACRGRFGICIEMTVRGIEHALSQGDERLCLFHFAEIWNERETLPLEENVFSSPTWPSIDVNARIGHDTWRARQ